MSSTKQRIVRIVDKIASYNTDELHIYGDCESFDWWRTIGVGRFFIPIIVVSAFYLVTFMAILASGMSNLILVWNFMTSLSIGFGIVSTLSLIDYSLNSATFCCVLFSMCITSQVIWKPFQIFKEEKKLQGRAKRSEIATYETSAHIIFCVVSIIICSFFIPEFSKPPRISLFTLAPLLLAHCHVVIPVLLTLAPPSTRPRQVRVAQMLPSGAQLHHSSSKYRVTSSRLSRTSTRSVINGKDSKRCSEIPRVIVKDETSF